MDATLYIEQAYLGDPSHRVFAITYLTNTSDDVVIVFPGLWNTFTEPAYLLPQLAQALQLTHCNVIIFDYLHNGDSDGARDDISLTALQRSGTVVIEYARKRFRGKCAILGYGIGNVLALGCTRIAYKIFVAPQWDVLNTQTQKTYTDEERWLELALGPITHDYASNVRTFPSDFKRDTVSFAVSALAGIRHDRTLIFYTDTISISAANVTALMIDDRVALPICYDTRTVVMNATITWLKQMQFGDQPHSAPRSRRDSSHDDYERNTRQLLTIPIGKEQIAGVLRLPDSLPINGPPVCVIYECGIPGTRVDSFQCGYLLAERLASLGIATYRYDSRGMGVSGGHFDDITLSRRVEDHKACLQALSALAPYYFSTYYVVGCSMGAMIAVVSAAREEQVAGSVLWCPILVEESQQSPQHMAVKRTRNGKIGIELQGLLVGTAYRKDFQNYNLAGMLENTNKPTFIVLASRDATLESTRLGLRAAHVNDLITTFHVEGPHCFNESLIPTVIRATTTWIETALESGARILYESPRPDPR